ncbi:MAG: hypothetical protein AB7I27_18095 [Bacteriovoracaceae bacterium]
MKNLVIGIIGLISMNTFACSHLLGNFECTVTYSETSRAEVGDTFGLDVKTNGENIIVKSGFSRFSVKSPKAPFACKDNQLIAKAEVRRWGWNYDQTTEFSQIEDGRIFLSQDFDDHNNGLSTGYFAKCEIKK